MPRPSTSLGSTCSSSPPTVMIPIQSPSHFVHTYSMSVMKYPLVTSHKFVDLC